MNTMIDHREKNVLIAEAAEMITVAGHLGMNVLIAEAIAEAITEVTAEATTEATAEATVEVNKLDRLIYN
jgi:hypothetical protein